MINFTTPALAPKPKLEQKETERKAASINISSRYKWHYGIIIWSGWIGHFGLHCYQNGQYFFWIPHASDICQTKRTSNGRRNLMLQDKKMAEFEKLLGQAGKKEQQTKSFGIYSCGFI